MRSPPPTGAPSMPELSPGPRGPGRYCDYGSIPIDRWYRVVRYAMPVAGRWAIAVLWLNATMACLLGGAGIVVIAPTAASGYDSYFATDLDLRVLYPVSGV